VDPVAQLGTQTASATAPYVLKARALTHSNQIREFIPTDHGVDLINVLYRPGGVLTGTARVVQEARENAEAFRRQAEIARRRRDLAHKRPLWKRARAPSASSSPRTRKTC